MFHLSGLTNSDAKTLMNAAQLYQKFVFITLGLILSKLHLKIMRLKAVIKPYRISFMIGLLRLFLLLLRI